MNTILTLMFACTGQATDDTQSALDSGEEAEDLAPLLSLEGAPFSVEVGASLLLPLDLVDEDTSGVTLTLTQEPELFSGDFDGADWTGTALEPGSTTLHFTATDAGGQTATLDVPVEVWQGRDWTLEAWQSDTRDELSGCVATDASGWAWVAGTTDYTGHLLGVGPQGLAWDLEAGATEYGNCADLDPDAGHLVYVGYDYSKISGVVRGLDADGELWATDLTGAFDYSRALDVEVRDGVAAVAGVHWGATVGHYVAGFDSLSGEVIGVVDLGAQHPNNEWTGVTQLADGSLLVAGWGKAASEAGAVTGPPKASGWVMKVDPAQLAAGEAPTELWLDLSLEEESVWVTQIQALSDGRVAVTGSTSGSLVQAPTGAEEGFLQVCNADGTLAWGYQHPASYKGRLMGVAEGPDGQLFAVADLGASGGGISVLAFGADGSLAWETALLGGNHMDAAGIAVQDQDIVVSASIQGDLDTPAFENLGDKDAALLRLGIDGSLSW